jgi:hypothetical protein
LLAASRVMAAPGSLPSTERAGRVFATTHWSLVLRAREKDSPDSQAALEHLCRTYWPPLYAYVRRQGFSTNDAEDRNISATFAAVCPCNR